MKSADLEKLGVPNHPKVMTAAFSSLGRAFQSLDRKDVKSRIRTVCTKPDQWVEDEIFGGLAQAVVDLNTVDAPENRVWAEREESAPWESWGKDLDRGSIQQMRDACRLPVSVRGALMPDAHTGYGLPIGGVLATENAVIPFGVGVDISCSMNLTVTDIPVHALRGEKDRLINVLEEETAFGMGAIFRDNPRDHEVLEDPLWDELDVARRLKTKAWHQLGTSGSSNHFFDYGIAEFSDSRPEIGIDQPGEYVAILSHSGSRGPGATIASHYTDLAKAEHPELPDELRYLAWLDLDTDQGREYWAAMTLMCRYAEACHQVMHQRVLSSLGAKAVSNVYNRHNMATKEVHDGREVVVHRKGATPAHDGTLGVIPGTMLHPAFIVRGRGEGGSLRSASHGAGRLMSRKEANLTADRARVRRELRKKDITVLSAGMDDNPFAYKNIEQVMALQSDLVEVLGRFYPKIVKMSPPGEKRKWQRHAKTLLTTLKQSKK